MVKTQLTHDDLRQDAIGAHMGTRYVSPEKMEQYADAWEASEAAHEATKRRLEGTTLPRHRCEMIAAAQWNDVGGRAHWVGRLLEPIPGYEEETHCMHFVTPLKGEVVFGFIEADFAQLAALCEAASSYPINSHWLRLKAQDYIGNVRYLRQQGVKAALAPNAPAAASPDSSPRQGRIHLWDIIEASEADHEATRRRLAEGGE